MPLHKASTRDLVNNGAVNIDAQLSTGLFSCGGSGDTCMLTLHILRIQAFHDQQEVLGTGSLQHKAIPTAISRQLALGSLRPRVEQMKLHDHNM